MTININFTIKNYKIYFIITFSITNCIESKTKEEDIAEESEQCTLSIGEGQPCPKKEKLIPPKQRPLFWE